MQYGSPELFNQVMVVYFWKKWAVKSDALLTILFCVMVGFSAWQILCHHNRRGPREEHVYGHSDWSTVKSGATKKQGVFVYCGIEDIADFVFLCWFLYKLMLPLSIWVCLSVSCFSICISVRVWCSNFFCCRKGCHWNWLSCQRLCE